MSIKILTANSIDNTNIDGARANNFNAGRRSGIVKGVLNEGRFFASSSNTIALDTCELRICGHRVVIDSIEYKTFTNTPSSDIRYSLVAQISVDNNADVTFALNTQLASTTLVQDNLDETGIGVYELEIGRFTLNTSGEIEDVVRTADLITGGIGQSGEGSINIGTITTTTLSTGLDAEVDIENRYNQSDNKTYTDFSFSIPQGASGNDGDDGVDALMTGLLSYSQPASTEHFYVANFLAAFNRKPKQGDRFLMQHSYNNKLYLANYSVNSVTSGDLSGEMSITLLTSSEISGADTNQKIKTSSVTFGNDDVVQITSGSNVTVTGDATNKTITIAATDTNTWRPVKVNGTEKLSNSTSGNSLDLVAGSNVSLSESNGAITINATDTTYSSQTAAQGGTNVSLVTTGEKYTWNNKQNALPTTSTAGKVLKSTSTAGTVEWGDASGGSAETPKTTISTSGSVSQTIQPNNYYEFTGDLTSLTLTQAQPISGIRNVYYVRFYCGDTIPTLTVTPYSGNLRWQSIRPTMLNKNTYYDLTISDNVATLEYTRNFTNLNTRVELTNNSLLIGLGGSLNILDNSTDEQATTSLILNKTYKIVATADTNYTLNRITLNNTIVNNNSTFNADYDTKVIAYFTGNDTTLTYNTPTGANVVVKKTSSSGDVISSGDTVKIYDIIYVAVSSRSGYSVSKTLTGLTAVSTTETNNSYYVTDLNPRITVTATPTS